MSKQDHCGRKIAEASTLGAGGKSDSYCIPIPDNHTNTITNSTPAPFHACHPPLQSLSAPVFVRASLLLSFPHLYSFHVCVFHRKEMQMCRFPTSLGNATGRLDREIKQSHCDACGKVAIKYSLTTIQTLSRATSGQVKKLNRDLMW